MSRGWRTGSIISAIAVDNVDEVVARYRARYPRGTVIAESGDLQHGEVRIYDPECNPVTLSQNNFGFGRRRRAFRASRILRSMRSTPRRSSISIATCSASASCSRPTRNRASGPAIATSMSATAIRNVAIQAFYSGEEGHEARFGIAHFGLLVPDSKAMAERVAGQRRHRQGAAGAPHAIGNPHARSRGQRLRSLAARLGGRHRQMGARGVSVTIAMRFAHATCDPDCSARCRRAGCGRSDRGFLPRQADQDLHPGGAGRQLRRLFARARPPHHALHSGQSEVVPVNMPGGGGLVALNYVANAAPQGRHRADHDHAVVPDGPGAWPQQQASRWTCGRSIGSAT